MTKGDTAGCVIKLVLVIAILAMSTFVGCAIGMSTANFLDSPEAQRWRILDPLPEKASKILAADVDFVFVQTVSGKVYYYAVDSVEIKGWKEVSMSRVYQRGGNRIWYTKMRIPPIPNAAGKIIDEAEANYGSAELISEAKYVISDDGKVWVWRWRPQSFIPAMSGIIPGSLIGFLLVPLSPCLFLAEGSQWLRLKRIARTLRPMFKIIDDRMMTQ